VEFLQQLRDYNLLKKDYMKLVSFKRNLNYADMITSRNIK
jgi:trans-2-enoyl-CoA reductase